MKNAIFCFTVFAAVLVSVYAQKDRCESKGIFTFGKCPEVCEPFSPLSSQKCSSLLQFGCLVRPCGDKPNFLSCSLERSFIESNPICPGDKIVFDSININSNSLIEYFLDLNASPLATDFYLLSDATRSMTDAIENVRTQFQKLIDFFEKDTKVGFGVGIYRDETELSNGFSNLQSVSENTTLSRNAVSNIRAIGGGDAPEANLVALYKVAKDSSIGWRKKSRKVLVYFGDQPGHEPTCNSGLPRITRKEVIDALRVKEITVVAVSVGRDNLNGATRSFGCGGSGAGAGQASAIATGTNGLFDSKINSAELVSNIIRLTENLPRKYEVDDSDCADKITSTFNPSLPLTLIPPASTTVKHTMKLLDRVCETADKFTCQFKFKQSGADLPSSTLEFVNIKGCESILRR